MSGNILQRIKVSLWWTYPHTHGFEGIIHNIQIMESVQVLLMDEWEKENVFLHTQ
jgi:hypothetical protein